MSEQHASFDEEQIEWQDQVTPHGKKYQVGYLRSEAPRSERLTELKSFGISVNWPVMGSDSWISTNEAVSSRAKITQYALYAYDGTWKYKLWFTNTEHYNYFFYDETGDYYQVNTFRNGNHYVRYNSESPTIVYITGS
jgi:hypothetical protein